MGSRICSQNIKIFLMNLYLHVWLIAKNMVKFSYAWSWKRLQNWKNEKIKKSLTSLLLSPFIIHYFIYLLNENFKLIN